MTDQMTPTKLARQLMYRRLAFDAARGGCFNQWSWDPGGLDQFEHWCLRQVVGNTFLDEVDKRLPGSMDDALGDAPQIAKDAEVAFWRAFCEQPSRAMVEQLFPADRIDQEALERVRVPETLEELPGHAVVADLRQVHGEATVATEADHKGTLGARHDDLCRACQVLRDDPPPRQPDDPETLYCIEDDVEWRWSDGRWSLPG